ncbi:unnamed protein product [Notodromas monacha]|uniref:Eukaryotic translation initiation factor 3 subunit K n=1 Tax=Notodromas monacha TaxID=399045 RepID=A0A7R9BSL6_9CRUS|nr:unnamed protein product [Notodromas monacha]CAG0920975.1 unnamed protein product [Notodromas monacha]
MEAMKRSVSEMLEGINRYNPENLGKLEQYLDMQLRENGYDLEANLTILKLYQFNPGYYRSGVTCKILMKALTNLPHPDFVLCKCLLGSEQMEDSSIKIILYLGDLLEMCSFPKVWRLLRESPAIYDKITGFEDSVRRYISHIIGITCQRIPRASLKAMMGDVPDPSLNAIIAQNNWREENPDDPEGAVIVGSQEDKVKTKNITEKIDFDILAFISRRENVVHVPCLIVTARDVMAIQRPAIWVSGLISRFEEQLPFRNGPQSSHSRLNIEQNKQCLIEISKHKFSVVISGLTRILQRITEVGRPHNTEFDKNYYESLITLLDTLVKCLNSQPRDAMRHEDTTQVRLLLREVCQFMDPAVGNFDQYHYNQNPMEIQLKSLASQVIFSLSQHNFNAVFNRVCARLQELSTSNEENPDLSDIELIQHIHIDLARLIRLFSETITKLKSLKKTAHIALITSLEKAVWTWLDCYPQEFAEIQRKPSDDLARLCDMLFDQLEVSADSNRRRLANWPLQLILLALCPRVLEEMLNAEAGAPYSPKHHKKKVLLDHIRKALVIHHHTVSKAATEAAVVACVRLCKVATYINTVADSTNIVFRLLQGINQDLKAILFNPSKPFCRGNQQHDIELMVDCFVSIFRISRVNDDALKHCLLPTSPPSFHFVLVLSLYKIITQEPLRWWPDISMMYFKSVELRGMLIDTLNKVIQGYVSHAPLKMQGFQGFTLKEKMTPLKFKEKTLEEPMNFRNLLYWLVKLICADPLLLLYSKGKAGSEVQSSTHELINGLVSLVHQQQGMTELMHQGMEASHMMFSISQKLIQHQIANYCEILKWLREIMFCRNKFLSKHRDYANLGSAIPICKQSHIKLEVVFLMYLWSVDIDAVLVAMSCFNLLCEEADIRCATDEISLSSLLPNYHVYQELAAASTVLTTGRAALQKRIMALLRKIETCSPGCYQAWDETYLSWDPAMRHLAAYPKPAGKGTLGGDDATNLCISDVSLTTLGFPQRMAAGSKRRASQQNSEHDLEDQINEWANMTGFLCALGGICLQRQRPGVGNTLPAFSSSLDSRAGPGLLVNGGGAPHGSAMSLSVSASVSTSTTSLCSVGTTPTMPAARMASNAFQCYRYQDSQYCAVTQFVGQLLRLLVCNNEKFGNNIQKHVKELVGHEMAPALYPILFEQIKAVVEKFFDAQGQVVVLEMNTQFIEHIIFIMKNVLENKTEHPAEHLGVTPIDGMMLAIVRYVRHLDSTVHALHIKTKLCQLVETMMQRHDDLTFRHEMKFRNKMVEYLTDWVMGNSHQIAAPGGQGDVTSITRDLDQACMEAVAALLHGMPLQSEECDRGDLMEAKSQLFLKYFTLFMNLLNDCSEGGVGAAGASAGVAAQLGVASVVIENPQRGPTVAPTACGAAAVGAGPGGDVAVGTAVMPGALPLGHATQTVPMVVGRMSGQRQSTLRNATIQAMSNLLSANIDSGLMHSIGLGYHRDLQTRAAFIEVLTKILQQGTEFDTLAETVLADRFEQLVGLVTMTGDKGELSLAVALASVVPTSQLDELARVLVTLFDNRRLLSSLMFNMFYRLPSAEVEFSDCMQTLFRGNSLGSKIMAFCFKIYGAAYLFNLLKPLIRPLIDMPNVSYEIDPARLGPNESLETNYENLLTLTQKVFDAITSTAEQFPPQLRSMCYCLYQVLSKRFPNSPQNNIGAVGTVVFLRFINPAIVSPYETGLIETQAPSSVKRGLMLMSKILQNIANHVEFSKEQHMLTFNGFLAANFETCRRFFVQISMDVSNDDQAAHNISFISDANVLALHRLLWTHQEKISASGLD